MEDDLIKELIEYWKIVNKKKKMILTLTLSIVLIVGILTVIQPKTYESSAIVEIGEHYYGQLLTSSDELRKIIQNPLFDRFIEEDKPDLTNVKIISLSDKYLIIKAEALEPNKSKESISVVIKKLSAYSEEFNEHKKLIIQEFNETIILANKNYNKKAQYINKELAERKNNIVLLEKEIGSIDSMFLLWYEKNRKSELEQELIDAKIELDIRKNYEKQKLRKGLIDIKQFRITGLETYLKSKNIKIKLLFALVAGLSFSVLLALMQEWTKKLVK